jgi:acyl-CoA synthetase (AMP-forming)/AMP-acid ligase II
LGPQDWTELVLELAAPEQADWVALEHQGQQMTIKTLARAMCAAAGILEQGQGVVAICEPDPIAHTVAVLGAVAAGRTAMLVDPKQPAAVLDAVVGASDAGVVVGRHVEGVSHLDSGELLGGTPIVPRRHDPEALGSIFLTSGSTGLPKLVQRTRNADLHAAMCLRLAGFPIDPGDRHWLCVPYAGAPFLTLLMGALLARATVVVSPFERAAVDAFLADQKITSAYLVPTMLRLAREHDGLDGPGWRNMRALMTGGEKLDSATADLLLSQFANRVYSAYGMTEIPRLTQATFEEMSLRPGTVGRTIPFRRAQIVEPGGDEPVPLGEEGEVLVTGPDLFSGYLGEAPAGTWHRTGDLGHLDRDGFLYITGRASSIVKVGGNRVSTDEVAAALRGHAGVAQAAVVALDDPTWTNRLEAFVVPRAGANPTERELLDWLEARQAAYKVPRAIHMLAELPLDSSGKLAQQTLLTLAAGSRGS